MSTHSTVQGKVFPSLLVVALASHLVYYINALNGTYPKCLPLIICAMISLVAGYFMGSVIKPAHTRRLSPASCTLDVKRLKRVSAALLLIGLAAHIYYYSVFPLQSYAESYGSSQGMGFITAFFIFWPLSIVLNEFVISRTTASKKFVVFNRLNIIFFCSIYFLLLMKRRQIIFLLLAVVAIWGPKMRKGMKWMIYISGFSLVLLFAVFGRVRGYYDASDLSSTIAYVLDNFSFDWISLDGLEGRYISRTLNDVVGYVDMNGLDPSVLLGVLFILIPSALLGGSKPLAFPEWYTYHFYPADYLAGTGYAGSMVGELYLIGGQMLLIFGYFCIGFVCARIQRRSRFVDDPVGNIVYAIAIYTMILLPRYDLASLLIDFVFSYVPLILAMRFSMRPKEGELPKQKADIVSLGHSERQRASTLAHERNYS
ncbi:Uncharacterised protein [uncultured Collinsella sp.]|nr:Uncharacterised protein [uncultured Collinsella sp.]